MARRRRARSGRPKRHDAGALLATALALVTTSARAGPPFLSDDPEPTDRGHWEIYNFATGAHGPGGLDGAAGLDLNYGGAKDLQLTAVVPLGFDDSGGVGSLRGGIGDVELAAKYRFLHQTQGGVMPDVSLFPRIYAPTGGSRFGGTHARLLIPVWAQKDWGGWSVFGGGGYEINPGAGQRDSWQGGVAVARTLSTRLQLGAEVFAQGDDAADGGGFTALNLGLSYRLVPHWSLLASAGPSWLHRDGAGEVFYLSLKADY